MANDQRSVLLIVFILSHGEQGEFTSDISSGREKPSFAGENCKDGIGMLIQFSDSIDCFFNEFAPKGIKGFGPIKL